MRDDRERNRLRFTRKAQEGQEAPEVEDATSGQIGPKSKKAKRKYYAQAEIAQDKQAAPADSAPAPADTVPTGADPTQEDAGKPPQEAPAPDSAPADSTPPPTSGQSGPESGADKKRRARSAEHSAQRKYSRKLRGEQPRPSDRLRHEDGGPGDGPAPGDGGADGATPEGRPGRRLNKSKLRMDKREAKLDAANDKLAAQKPIKRPGPVKTVTRVAGAEAHGYVHGKIHQVEHENVGTEAAHKTELAGERVVGGGYRFTRRRIRTRPARRVARADRKAIKARADYNYRKLVNDHPEIGGSNPISRAAYRRRLKRQYAKQARAAAQKSAQATKSTTVTTARLTRRVVRAVAGFVQRHPIVTVVILLLLALVVIVAMLVSTLALVGSGMVGVTGASSYVADDADIDMAELHYTELETDLKLQINSMESDNPNYDEYRYSVAEISHNPYELIAFLTALYGDFSFSEVRPLLNALFAAQYGLETETYVETVTETVEIEVGASIGQVRTSAYCPCVICCGPYADGITASGTRATAGRTIAVDAYNPILPMGTQVVINGVQYTVEDTGNLNANNVDFDIFFSTHAEALAWGKQTHTAYLADGGGGGTIEVTITRVVSVMEITVTSTSFTSMVYSLMDSEQREHYNVLMATKGNRQYLDNVFGFNWLPYVTSNYGWRVHPTTGLKITIRA